MHNEDMSLVLLNESYILKQGAVKFITTRNPYTERHIYSSQGFIPILSAVARQMLLW
jgi:hypothetical protein